MLLEAGTTLPTRVLLNITFESKKSVVTCMLIILHFAQVVAKWIVAFILKIFFVFVVRTKLCS